MEWKDIILTVGTVITALGGFEFVKWLFTRKYGKRVDEATADDSEFGVLKKTNEFLQEQLLKKEERFAAQTDVLRATTARELELTRKVATLETERGLKLCERRNCSQREPQSGY